MQKFSAQWAVTAGANLEKLETWAKEKAKAYSTHPGEVANMGETLKTLADDCGRYWMKSTSDYLTVFRNTTKEPNFPELESCARVVRGLLEKDMKAQAFLQLTPNEASNFLKERPFGDAVWDAYPSARYDTQEALNCWATGRYTASVFHAMRSLEHPLRLMAAEFNIQWETEVWHTIIEAIQSAIKKEGDTLPRGAPKQQRMQFLSEAAKEFTYFKDGWRNYVSHGHQRYDEHSARSVVNHAGAFMTALSKHLHE